MMLTASPRRRARQPFRRTVFPRGDVDREPRNNAAANPGAAPAGAPGAPWWRALLDALAAAPAVNRARRQAPRDDDRDASRSRSEGQRGEAPRAGAGDDFQPVTERLDRHREQLASIDEHLRRLVELQSQRDAATAVYAPPA